MQLAKKIYTHLFFLSTLYSVPNFISSHIISFKFTFFSLRKSPKESYFCGFNTFTTTLPGFLRKFRERRKERCVFTKFHSYLVSLQCQRFHFTVRFATPRFLPRSCLARLCSLSVYSMSLSAKKARNFCR